jgi:ATP-dependent Clp protease ATP-binding subunit ClpA
VQITPAARNLIATLGYDPVYGARPLKRVIQRQILDPLSVKLIAGDIAEGEIVVIDERDGQFTFHASMSEAPVVA